MNQRIPFLDDLRADLLSHAPPGLESDPQLRVTRRPVRLRGVPVAIVTFVFVVLVGGAMWWLIPGGSQDSPLAGAIDGEQIEWDLRVLTPQPEDPDRFVAEVSSLLGVAEVQYLDSETLNPPQATDLGADSTPVSTTLRPGVTVPPDNEPPLPMTALLVRLDGSVEPALVAEQLHKRDDVRSVEYSEDIADGIADTYFAFVAEGARVLSTDPLVLQPLPGAEPRFDVSALGTEVVLEPADSIDPIPASFWRVVTDAGALSAQLERSPSRPALHIGRVAEIDARLIVYGTVSNGVCAFIVEAQGSGGGCDSFSGYPGYGLAGVGGTEGELGYITVRVPEETAVVTVSINGADTLWQRPVAGWVMFPTESFDIGMHSVIDAYAADRSLLGHWEDTL